MKKIVSGLLTAALLVTSSGCSSDEGQEDEIDRYLNKNQSTSSLDNDLYVYSEEKHENLNKNSHNISTTPFWIWYLSSRNPYASSTLHSQLSPTNHINSNFVNTAKSTFKPSVSSLGAKISAGAVRGSSIHGGSFGG